VTDVETLCTRVEKERRRTSLLRDVISFGDDSSHCVRARENRGEKHREGQVSAVCGGRRAAGGHDQAHRDNATK
jgi:hypothetical protein